MKIFTLPLAVFFLCVAAHAQPGPEIELESKYDRYTNKTTVMLHERVVKGQDTSLYFSAGATFEGEHPKEWATRVILSVGIISKSPLRANDTKLYVLLDGKPLELERLELLSFQPDSPYSTTVYGVLLHADILSKIATAKKAEMRFDSVEFTLSSAQQIKIIDFLRMTRP